jgi:hypothetical protein
MEPEGHHHGNHPLLSDDSESEMGAMEKHHEEWGSQVQGSVNVEDRER